MSFNNQTLIFTCTYCIATGRPQFLASLSGKIDNLTEFWIRMRSAVSLRSHLKREGAGPFFHSSNLLPENVITGALTARMNHKDKNHILGMAEWQAGRYLVLYYRAIILWS